MLQLYHIIWKGDALLLAMFNPLYISTNQQLFEKSFCSHYENYGAISVMNGSHHVPIKVSKGEWDTKEGTGKSMKNALYVQ